MDLTRARTGAGIRVRSVWSPGFLAERPRPWRIAWRTLLSVLLALFLMWLILFITKGRFLKGPFESIASSQTDRQVTVGGDFQLYFAPFDIKFRAEKLAVSNPGWASAKDLFAADLIDARIAPLPLLFGKKTIDWLELVNGDVQLEWDKARKRNTWTFANSDPSSTPSWPDIARARLVGTTVSYVDPLYRIDGKVKFDTAQARNDKFTDALRFAGGGTMRAKPFTLSGSLDSPNQTAGGGKNKLKAHFEAVDSVVDLSGTLPGATQIEKVPLALTIHGASMADLFTLIGVAIPASRNYKMTATMTKVGPEYRITGIKSTVGQSDLSGDLIVAMKQPRLLLTGDLTSQNADIVDLASSIGYDADRLARLGTDGVIGAGGGQRVLPDAKLRTEALGNFDADIRLRIKTIRAKSFPISNVDAQIGLDDRKLSVSPFSFTMARGKVNGDVVVNARRSPVVTDYDIRMGSTPMGTVLAGFGVEKSGTTGTMKGRVQLRGTGDSVHQSLSSASGRIAIILPSGTLNARNSQLSELDIGTFAQKMFTKKLNDPVDIKCGLIAFTVRDGLAAADPVLIDTHDNVVTGRGGFSFRTEAIDMAFRADSKQFSLFSGQSPIGLGGMFAAPHIDPISDQLLARAGVGLGLAIVAAPVAGVLAFVDVGDAKSTACGPVLSGARANAQRTTKGEKRDDVGDGSDTKADGGKTKKKKFLGIF